MDVQSFLSFFRRPRTDASNKAFRKAYFFAFPLFLLFLVETVSRSDFWALFIFAGANPFIAAFSYVWILAVQTLAFFIFGRASFFVSSLSVSILAVAHAEKLRTLAEPLYATDVLAHASALGTLAGFSGIPPSSAVFAPVLFALFVSFVGWRRFPPFSFADSTSSDRAFRFGWIVVFSALNFAVFFNAFGTLSMIQKAVWLTPEEYSWRQIENYERNGFLGGFFTNLGNFHVNKPEGYSVDAVEKMSDEYRHATSASGTKRPNVVFVLSESFWDPTALPGVSFERDPVSNFRDIRKSFGGGEIVSPTFWGKTALVEFEILTGNSVAWIPKGSIPYQQYFRRDVPSIVWEFRNAGYSTTAIHTYHKNFFSRIRAYPLLGFERFIGLEDMPDAQTKGKFVSDATLTDYILDAVGRATPDAPAFVFAVSMENHFSYEGDKFNRHDIGVLSSALPENDLLTLKNYVQGVHDADTELRRLITELEKIPEPTYVVFFGDHLGILGDRYRVYEKTGFVPSSDDARWSAFDRLKMRTPPFVAWNNFSHPEPFEADERIRAPFFWTRFLQGLGISRVSPFFRFLSDVEPCFSNPAPELSDAFDPKSFTKRGKSCASAMREWEAFQYANLFGR